MYLLLWAVNVGVFLTNRMLTLLNCFYNVSRNQALQENSITEGGRVLFVESNLSPPVP